MADLQLLDRARGASADALQELAISGSYGSRGYSKSKEDLQQAAFEGLHAARKKEDKKAQAFALYALVRFRILQGETSSRCQQDALQGTKLLKEVGQSKHAGDLQLLMARSSLVEAFDAKPATAARHAADAFNMYEAQADKADALIVQAEANLLQQQPGEAIAIANKAMPLLQGDTAREASTLILLGKAQLAAKDFAEAEKSGLSASEKAVSDNGLAAAAKAVVAESMLARDMSNGKAIAVEALELAQGTDAFVEASMRLLLAKNSLRTNPSEAVDNAEKAMTILLLRNETKLEAAATHVAAQAHMGLGHCDAALRLAMQAAQTANGFGDIVMEANALHTASQARDGKNQTGEALLAARKAAELFHSIGDKEGEKRLSDAISKIQDKMPVPHRPTNVLMLKEPLASPQDLMSQTRHCIVWSSATKDSSSYIQYSLELLRLVDEISKTGTMTPLLVCSMGAMARPLGCPVAAQQKDINGLSVYGVVRTVRLEMPRLPISAVDLPTDADPSELARVICDASEDTGPRNEVAYSKTAGPGKELLKKMGRDTSGM